VVLAGQGRVEPLLSWRGCEKRFIGSARHPRSLAESLVSAGEEYVALLESGGGLQHRSRYSFVAYGASEAVELSGFEGVYDAMERALSGSNCESLPCRDQAFFLVSYEAVGDVERFLRPLLRRHEWPVLALFKPERLVVYDHAAERVIECPPGASSPPSSTSRPTGGFRAVEVTYATPRGSFEEWVEEALGEIERGEVFQVVLSRVERISYRGSLFAAYKRLAEINPSPYMFYVGFAGRVAMGASPELLVKLDSGRLETHPIAGTRPRGEGDADVALEEEMLADEKEFAEHVMLVDLARNDLASIAVPGTVRVTSFMDVEKYSFVQHIVSRVEAEAREGLTFPEALRAMLPAGTVSGAPKPRAMEIIARLEAEARGPYAGAVGLAGLRAGEAAIVIRSAWSVGEGEVEIRAGAGIVYDSRPEREYMETEYKLRALKKALGVA
jgi:anthranilate synthase component 1